MNTTQITLRNIRSSTALQERIREMREHLDRFHPGILGCRVAIEAGEARKERGRQFTVNVRVRVPGHEIVANHSHDEDVYAALAEAFGAVRRQLLDTSGAKRAARDRSPKQEGFTNEK